MGDVRVYDKSAEHSAFIIALDGDNLLHNPDIGSIFLSDPVIIATFVFHDLFRRKLLPELGDSGLKIDEMRKIIRMNVLHQYIQREFRSEEHTSELQSLMRISYAVFCLKKK